MNQAGLFRVLPRTFIRLLVTCCFLSVALTVALSQTLSITNQPQSRTLTEGDSVTFTVGVDAAESLSYQWRKRGTAIPGANSAEFTIPSLLISDSGLYSVVVIGGANTVTSSNAILRVAPHPQQLVSFGDTWQYNQGGTNLGTSWRSNSYNDSFWSSGPSLFGVEDSENPAISNLLQTPLVLTNQNGARFATYYFRKRVPGISANQAISVRFTNFVDDGAVFYLNGVELFRYNLPQPPTVISFFTSASASVEASPLVTNVSVNLPASQDLVFAAELHNVNPANLDAVFGSSIVIYFRPPDPPAITQQPLAQDAVAGGSVSFTSSVSGSSFSVQWLKDGSPLPGQTNLQLTIPQCSLSDVGAYALQVSNLFDTLISDSARLRVVSSNSIPLVLVTFSDPWKYNSSGVDLATAWKFPAYDDSAWPTGKGMFANFNDYPEPVGTVIPLKKPPGVTILTHYFRRHFNCPLTNALVTLITTNLLDDGAVFYLNGSEAARVRMTAGPITYDTLAFSAPNNGHSYEAIAWPAGNLLKGDNFLAVEVHQTTDTSSDIGFGFSLAIQAKSAMPLTAFFPLTNVTVKEFEPFVLRSALFGSYPAEIQWYKDGQPLGGGNDLNVSVSTSHDFNAGEYYFIASNPISAITSSVVHVTVLQDRIPPTLLSAVARQLNSVVLGFSEELDPASATNVANYILSPEVSITSIRMATPSSVVLTLAALPPGALQVSVSNVRDLAIPPNTIAPNSTVSVTFDPAVLGHPFTAIQTVFLIVFENTSWSRILGSTNAPYFNSILPMASYAAQFYSPTGLHGSLSRYIWMEAGTNFNVVDDRDPSFYHFNTPHFTSLLDQAGVPWKGYQENISGNDCPVVGISPYAVRHNPTMYFDDVTSSLEYCTNHMRPYAELAGDLASNRVARFIYIKPNTTNDMHDNVSGIPSLTVGDNWLAAELPKILNSAAYTNNGLVLLTWDEDDIGGLDDAIGMIALSPLAKAGYYNSIYYDHSAILRTMQEIFGVRPFLGGAAASPDFSDLFKLLAISSISTSPQGAALLTFTNTIPGKMNWLQASGDLVNWTTIATNLSTTNSLQISDPSGPTTTRFYRLFQE